MITTELNRTDELNRTEVLKNHDWQRPSEGIQRSLGRVDRTTAKIKRNLEADPSVYEALPIERYKEEIIKTIEDNDVTIITAETGAGKSTQVPKYLLEQGYEVIVTQPRRLAAMSVAERVADELDSKLGTTVGYKTGDKSGKGSCYSADTKVLFCTDGLQMIRELTGHGVGGKKKTVLVLDEVHEWNVNMETLVAWAKKQNQEGNDFKIVLMSATLDSESLARFYGKEEQDAPVVEVPGRLFEVEEKEAPAEMLISETLRLAREGRNVLVFRPGKKEIEETIEALKRAQINVEILPLHGQLDREEQRKVFNHYKKPKIVVSTNVAQTSVTIDDIDAVVDSGLERRVELRNNIEGLYLRPTSKADCKQRKGRAGRCRPGEYVLCYDTSLEERADFPLPEIQRTRLDQTVLRLATLGIDATELEFFHQPDRATLREAKRALKALGAMDESDRVTEIGRQISRLPINVHTGRMVIEAMKNECMDDVLTIAACLEQGSVRDRTEFWRELTAEQKSDVLAELDLYEAALRMRGNQEMRESGIFAKSFQRAKETRRDLQKAVESAGMYRKQQQRNGRDRGAILSSVLAGMVDHLYQKNGRGNYTNGDGAERIKGRESVVYHDPQWLVGLPKDIQFRNRRGDLQTLSLVSMCSEVDPMALAEIAPQLVRKETGLSPRFDSEQDVVVSKTSIFFKDQHIGEETVMDAEHPQAPQVFAEWLSEQITDSSTPLHEIYESQKRARDLNIRAGKPVFRVYNSQELSRLFEEKLQGAKCVGAVTREIIIDLLTLAQIDENTVQQVLNDNPESITINGINYEVKYEQYHSPRIFIDASNGDNTQWLELPEEDAYIYLPSGQKVEVRVQYGGGTYDKCVGTEISKLKQELTERLNNTQWENANFPDLPQPDESDYFAITIPEVEEMIYGTCVTTGSPLRAYGSVRLNQCRYYEGDPLFSTAWFRDRESAQEARTKALEKLHEIQEKSRGKINEIVWERWERPDLPLPDTSNVLQTRISPVSQRQYGMCAVTGAPLYAYGTMALLSLDEVNVYSETSRVSLGDMYLKTRWFQKEDEAQAQNEKVLAYLERLKEEQINFDEMLPYMERARGVLRRIQDLEGNLYEKLPSDMGGDSISSDCVYSDAKDSIKKFDDLRRELSSLTSVDAILDWIERAEKALMEEGNPLGNDTMAQALAEAFNTKKVGKKSSEQPVPQPDLQKQKPAPKAKKDPENIPAPQTPEYEFTFLQGLEGESAWEAVAGRADKLEAEITRIELENETLATEAETYDQIQNSLPNKRKKLQQINREIKALTNRKQDKQREGSLRAERRDLQNEINELDEKRKSLKAGADQYRAMEADLTEKKALLERLREKETEILDSIE